MTNTVFAAKLYGKIYDIELNELNNVVVEVDSEPKQRYVSKDGGYEFELESGNYVISANYSKLSFKYLTTEENVSIVKEGDYVFDLFLFPALLIEDEGLVSVDDMELSDPITSPAIDGGYGIVTWVIIILAIIVLIALYFVVGYFKKQEEFMEVKEGGVVASVAKDALSEDSSCDDLDKVVAVIKREGGRITQKELRKEFPLSEAKISLMISELEHKKIVQKVKKGRGNIIILNKEKVK